MLSVALVLALTGPGSEPPVIHDWLKIGPLQFERTQRLTWPGLYRLQLLGAPERRIVNRFSVRRTGGLLDVSVITVGPSLNEQPPPRAIGSYEYKRGAMWGQASIRLPRRLGAVGGMFRVRGSGPRPAQFFFSGRF